MTRHNTTLALGSVVVAIGLAGCGGSGSGPSAGAPEAPSPTGDTITLGTLQVGVASAAGFKTKTLNSPDFAQLAFTAMYGTRIIRLEDVGYGRIAFHTNRGSGGDNEIAVMNADGTDQTLLTSNKADDSEPEFSPDGMRIAFWSDRDGDAEIYLINADGSNPTRLTNNGADDVEPNWSPDGSQIVFVSDRADNDEIWKMNADGSKPRRLTNDAAAEADPDWSPDGTKIIFESDRDGDNELFIMNTDGSGQTNLTTNGVSDNEPAWSPDGRKIAFERRGDIWVMNRDGSNVQQLTHSGGTFWPAWSPDSRKLLFRDSSEGNDEIYVMDASGANVRNLTNHGRHDRAPSWSPQPTVRRTIIGAPGSDGSFDPPFGARRPLVIVGISSDGLASAATVATNSANWPGINVVPITDIGINLVGARITAGDLRAVQEDIGRGISPRAWNVRGSPNPGAVLIFLDANDGHIASVLSVTDRPLATGAVDAVADVTASLQSGEVILRGSFAGAFDARDPSRNLIRGGASEVVLDGRTGEVVQVN